MVAWIVWLIVAAVLGVAELVTFTFALGLIAVGACVAAAVAALQLGLPFQLLAFVIASVAGLGLGPREVARLKTEGVLGG